MQISLSKGSYLKIQRYEATKIEVCSFLCFRRCNGLSVGQLHRATPRWTNSYFHREANVKRICDTMAGTYDMSYFRIYRTDLRGGQDVVKDSVIRAMLPDSAAPLQYVVGGYGDQRITIPNFPISLVAPCLKDTALARAVASAPLQNLLVRYGLSGGLSDKESEGYVRLAPEPLSLTLNVGGKQCVVEFDFECKIFIGIDGENPTTLKVSPLQFSLDDVKILGGSNQDFSDGWSNGPTFDIYINGERVDQAGQPVRRR